MTAVGSELTAVSSNKGGHSFRRGKVPFRCFLSYFIPSFPIYPKGPLEHKGVFIASEESNDQEN